MLLELSELLAKTNEVDEIVISNYTLKEGIYFKLDLNGNIIDELVVNKNTDKMSELYQWFKERDYYSKLIMMNKYIGDKRIHSNNMYTVFIKVENLPEIGKNSIISTIDDLKIILDKYFDKLNSKPNKEEKDVLKYCSIQGIDKNLSNRCKYILESGLKQSIERIKNIKETGNYLKLFIMTDENNDADIKNYKRESERYVMPKIFNDNKYNKYSGDELLGLSNENMQLNSHKPFLKLYGTKFKVPYRVSLNQALINKKVFEWMGGSQKEDGKPNMKFSIPYDYDFKISPDDDSMERGILIETISDKGERVVVDGDSIPKNITYLKRPFKYVIFFKLKEDEDRTIIKRSELETLIDKVFFKNKMKILYYDSSYKPKGCSSIVMNAMNIMRIPMKNYFRLGIENNIEPLIKKLTMMIVKDGIRSNESGFYDLKQKMNLRLSLLKYFKREGETSVGDIVIDIADSVKNIVLGEGEASAESDNEFYYCVGQLTRYIFDRSETAQKKMDMYTPVLDAKNAKRIKDILKDAAVRYAHNIDINNRRYKRLLRMVMGYETDGKPDGDMILCGICDDNIIYTKKEEKQ